MIRTWYTHESQCAVIDRLHYRVRHCLFLYNSLSCLNASLSLVLRFTNAS